MKYPNMEAERIKHRMSRDQFAESLGVSKRTVQNWQTGRSDMPLSKLVKACDVLGCRSDYLLGLDAGDR